MPGSVSPVVDERDGLTSYLAQQRYVLRLTAYGLTEEQAAAVTSPSALCVGGIIKHVTDVERYWMDVVVQNVANKDERDAGDDYQSNFRLGPDDSLQKLLDAYAGVAADTDKVIESISDLGQAVPIPRDAPWFPKDIDAWSVRWVILHLIQETARHAGHADIVREGIDSANAFALMAAAEGWPSTPWLQPWEPKE
jgi:uncharacterized damage-inducible protein DinB